MDVSILILAGSILCVFAPLAFFALLLIWVIAKQREIVAAKRQRASELGFRIPEQPDPAFQNRINGLYKSTLHSNLRLSNVFQKTAPDYEMYLFDLSSSSDESTTELASNALALVSSRWNLPRFSIYPKVTLDGIAGKVVQGIYGLARSISPQGLCWIEFPTCPDFDRVHLVTGSDEAAVRGFLSEDVLTRLCRIEPCRIEAGGDILVFDRPAKTINRPGLAEEAINEATRALVRDAPWIFDLFCRTG